MENGAKGSPIVSAIDLSNSRHLCAHGSHECIARYRVGIMQSRCRMVVCRSGGLEVVTAVGVHRDVGSSDRRTGSHSNATGIKARPKGAVRDGRGT